MNTFQSILGSDGDLTLRFATLEDAEALLEIYAPYISQPVTFEYEVPPLEEFRHRIIERIAFGIAMVVPAVMSYREARRKTTVLSGTVFNHTVSIKSVSKRTGKDKRKRR